MLGVVNIELYTCCMFRQDGMRASPFLCKRKTEFPHLFQLMLGDSDAGGRET